MTQPSTHFELRATREYREWGYKMVKCPVCGRETLDNYWICRNCGWEYDGTTEEHEHSACNRATLAEYRKNTYNAQPTSVHTHRGGLLLFRYFGKGYRITVAYKCVRP